MFDTMTMTKATAAVCSALLVLLLGKWAATSLYSTDPNAGHHGEEPVQAYAIDTGAAAGGAEEAGAAEADFATIYASADAAAGEKVFGKCKACHKLDGKDVTGPHLNGIVDRAIASAAGFAYSTSMAEHADSTWTPEHLDTFLKAPKGFASNTKMSFAGLPKPEDRANLIAFLATQQ
ncbi:c-type cytochrome [Pseudogemmobacter faecipullorum]|uniref:Cytochrome c family protein n=1 Tax=Pseudogemmobacter faecipullorum TaxID=2755041 RepID=A0ABS8CJI0_9RHOB|nr:cytochrome c family protein [Pseudogemmobacter faecipullorum]MCB5409529.1 cytochrome c family protein [Pseudogemmobacter faecipullorum]